MATLTLQCGWKESVSILPGRLLVALLAVICLFLRSQIITFGSDVLKLAQDTWLWIETTHSASRSFLQWHFAKYFTLLESFNLFNLFSNTRMLFLAWIVFFFVHLLTTKRKPMKAFFYFCWKMWQRTFIQTSSTRKWYEYRIPGSLFLPVASSPLVENLHVFFWIQCHLHTTAYLRLSNILHFPHYFYLIYN